MVSFTLLACFTAVFCLSPTAADDHGCECRASGCEGDGKKWCYLEEGLDVSDECKQKTDAQLSGDGDKYWTYKLCGKKIVDFTPPLVTKGVSCQETQMVITLDFCGSADCGEANLMRFLPDQVTGKTSLHLNDESCVQSEVLRRGPRGTGKATLIFRTDYDKCGTKKVTGNNEISYRQTVSTFDSLPEEVSLQFHCSFKLEKDENQPHILKVVGIPGDYVKCGDTNMELQLPQYLLSQYKASELHLDDPNCRMEQKGIYFKIKTDYTKCGGQVTVEDGKILMINTLKSSLEGSIITRKKQVNIKFGCEFSQSQTQTAKGHIVSPATAGETQQVKVQGDEFDIALHLVRSRENLVPVDATSYSMKVGERAFATLTVTEAVIALDLVPVASNCYVTPLSDPDTTDITKRYYLLRDKCIEDATTKVERIRTGQLISFDVFAYTHNTSENLVIQCDAVMCDVNDTSCQSCSKSLLRRKRSITKENLLYAKKKNYHMTSERFTVRNS